MQQTKEAKLIAVITGIAAAQTKIAVKTAKSGAPVEVSALEAGTAVGLLIALNMAGKAFEDKNAENLVSHMVTIGHLEEMMIAKLKTILEE